jgi:hypothetical protein
VSGPPIDQLQLRVWASADLRALSAAVSEVILAIHELLSVGGQRSVRLDVAVRTLVNLRCVPVAVLTDAHQPPLYSTLASYLAAIETHGATVGDIPKLVGKLRETSDAMDVARARIADLEGQLAVARPVADRGPE